MDASQNRKPAETPDQKQVEQNAPASVTPEFKSIVQMLHADLAKLTFSSAPEGDTSSPRTAFNAYTELTELLNGTTVVTLLQLTTQIGQLKLKMRDDAMQLAQTACAQRTVLCRDMAHMTKVALGQDAMRLAQDLIEAKGEEKIIPCEIISALAGKIEKFLKHEPAAEIKDAIKKLVQEEQTALAMNQATIDASFAELKKPLAHPQNALADDFLPSRIQQRLNNSCLALTDQKTLQDSKNQVAEQYALLRRLVLSKLAPVIDAFKTIKFAYLAITEEMQVAHDRDKKENNKAYFDNSAAKQRHKLTNAVNAALACITKWLDPALKQAAETDEVRHKIILKHFLEFVYMEAGQQPISIQKLLEFNQCDRIVMEKLAEKFQFNEYLEIEHVRMIEHSVKAK